VFLRERKFLKFSDLYNLYNLLGFVLNDCMLYLVLEVVIMNLACLALSLVLQPCVVNCLETDLSKAVMCPEVNVLDYEFDRSRLDTGFEYEISFMPYEETLFPGLNDYQRPMMPLFEFSVRF